MKAIVSRGATVRSDHVKATLPPMRIEIPRDLADRVAKHVARRLERKMGAQGGRWRGLAHWLADNLKIDGNAVTWPSTAATERFDVSSQIDGAWVDEAIRHALKDAIK